MVGNTNNEIVVPQHFYLVPWLYGILEGVHYGLVVAQRIFCQHKFDKLVMVATLLCQVCIQASCKIDEALQAIRLYFGKVVVNIITYGVCQAYKACTK
jgi:hypothetical protein